MVIGLAELKSTEYVVSIVDLNYLELDVLGMFLACLPHFASMVLVFDPGSSTEILLTVVP